MAQETAKQKRYAKIAEKWYDAGLYNDVAMRNLVEKGCITAEAYERITGMAYEEVTV